MGKNARNVTQANLRIKWDDVLSVHQVWHTIIITDTSTTEAPNLFLCSRIDFNRRKTRKTLFSDELCKSHRVLDSLSTHISYKSEQDNVHDLSISNPYEGGREYSRFSAQPIMICLTWGSHLTLLDFHYLIYIVSMALNKFQVYVIWSILKLKPRLHFSSISKIF